MSHAFPDRRRTLFTLGVTTLSATLAGLLGGCGTSAPVQLYHLASAPPGPVPAPPTSDQTWQLMLPVRVPEYLDREAILLPQGQTGLMALSGHRWAESLRDAVPRVLRQDLAALLGGDRVWSAPVPPGVAVTRQLRVEIVSLQADATRHSVSVQARWTLTDPQGRQPPRTETATLQAPSRDETIDSLVAAHRQVLWQLAGRIAAAR